MELEQRAERKGQKETAHLGELRVGTHNRYGDRLAAMDQSKCL